MGFRRDIFWQDEESPYIRRQPGKEPAPVPYRWKYSLWQWACRKDYPQLLSGQGQLAVRRHYPWGKGKRHHVFYCRNSEGKPREYPYLPPIPVWTDTTAPGRRGERIHGRYDAVVRSLQGVWKEETAGAPVTIRRAVSKAGTSQNAPEKKTDRRNGANCIINVKPGSRCLWAELCTVVSKEAKVSDTLVFLWLFNYQGALTVGYHKQCSFYRRRLFAAYRRNCRTHRLSSPILQKSGKWQGYAEYSAFLYHHAYIKHICWFICLPKSKHKRSMLSEDHTVTRSMQPVPAFRSSCNRRSSGMG